MQKAVKDSLYSFSKSHRLCHQHDFSKVFSRPDGKLIHSPWIVLFTRNQLKHSRLGIVIKKSVVKRAVDRNYLRRVLRESFRCHPVSKCSFDVVVLVDSSMMRSMHRAREAAEAVWQQLMG